MKSTLLLILISLFVFTLSFGDVIFSIYSEGIDGHPDFSNPRRSFMPGERVYFTSKADPSISGTPTVSILGKDIALVDNGTDGDLFANDSVFTGSYTLPATLQDQESVDVVLKCGGTVEATKMILIDKNTSANCYREGSDNPVVDFGEGPVVFKFSQASIEYIRVYTSSNSIDSSGVGSHSFTFYLSHNVTDNNAKKIKVSQDDIVNVIGYSEINNIVSNMVKTEVSITNPASFTSRKWEIHRLSESTMKIKITDYSDFNTPSIDATMTEIATETWTYEASGCEVTIDTSEYDAYQKTNGLGIALSTYASFYTFTQRIMADFSPHIYDFNVSPTLWQGEGDVTISFEADTYPLYVEAVVKDKEGNVIDTLTENSESNMVEMHWDIKDKIYETGEYSITVVGKALDTDFYTQLVQAKITVSLSGAGIVDSKGGTVTSADGLLKVVIPENAVSNKTYIQIAQDSSIPKKVSDAIDVRKGYVISPEDLALAKSVNLIFSPSTTSNISELEFFYYDGNSISEVQTEVKSGKVECRVFRFGEYFIGKVKSILVGTEGGSVHSVDGSLNITIPYGALSQPTWVTVKKAVTPTSVSMEKVDIVEGYTIFPTNTTLTKTATLSLLVTSGGISSLRLFNYYEGGYNMLTTTVDRSSNTISTSISRFGTYYVGSIVSAPIAIEGLNIALLSNIVTGVSDNAVFRLSPATEVQRATIFDLNGRKVKELVKDEMVDTLRWDGTDFMGEPVNSGIYMLVIFRKGYKPVMKLVGVRR